MTTTWLDTLVDVSRQLRSPTRTPPPAHEVEAQRFVYTTPLRRKTLLGDTDAARHLVTALKRFQERMANHTAVQAAYTEWHRIVGAEAAPAPETKEAWFMEQMAHLEHKYGLLFDAGAGNTEGCAAVQHALGVLRAEDPLPAHLAVHVGRQRAPTPALEVAEAWQQQRAARVAALSAAKAHEAEAEAAACVGVAFDARVVSPLVKRPTATRKRSAAPRTDGCEPGAAPGLTPCPSVDEAAHTILRNAGPAALWHGDELPVLKRAKTV